MYKKHIYIYCECEMVVSLLGLMDIVVGVCLDEELLNY